MSTAAGEWTILSNRTPSLILHSPLQNKLYTIRNYTVVPDEYPLGSPAVQYTMGLTFYRANRTVARAVVDGAVVYKDRK